ncbi:aminoglycoside phosphotransferase [Paenibacillus sp. PK3_47]|uniref:phosphotransferase n=1 Tax=Paenibacillus sp. PK3_47 TaxID=2072642 RepID=UPI00201D3643|nr:phosphotransferase [Paenibacillus sp. PK3_47]UQZ34971.1 aminoglycoside phosphotransferase [Paenibacillus sp. PK3_47]
MSDTSYNLQFDKLCSMLQLGDIVGVPEVITGGLLHRMYMIVTTQGKYAVKALNPQIMIRPTAMQNFIDSERIAEIASRHVPALPAQRFQGTAVHNIDGQHYLVFEWTEGRSLRPDEITAAHCYIIGGVLADLHKVDFSELNITNNGGAHIQLTDWNHYLHLGQKNNAQWMNLLSENIQLLYSWNAQANNAAERLASGRVISHWDLDAKNVMWNDGTPLFIDWEASGYIHPMQNLIETALYWSEDGTGNINKERFQAFIAGYARNYGTLQADWKTVLENGFSGKLGWLEYSLKRSLGIECTDEKEQQTGTEQVGGTLHALNRYGDTIAEIENWLNNEI